MAGVCKILALPGISLQVLHIVLQCLLEKMSLLMTNIHYAHLMHYYNLITRESVLSQCIVTYVQRNCQVSTQARS